MKKGFVFFAGFLMAGSAANAQISDASEMMSDAFDLLDVNSDGVILSGALMRMFCWTMRKNGTRSPD